jgi:uncharacterized protein YjbI with pentapeptide repeats
LLYDFILLVYNGNNLSETDDRRRFKKAVIEDNLREQDFTDADLRGLDMRALRLSGVSFSGANLSFVDASGADFSGCDMRYMKMRHATLRDALLFGAEAIEADFLGTNLDNNVDLRFADLRRARADLRAVDNSVLIGTILPDGNLGDEG